MSSGLDVRGGAGGVAADLDDLRSTARVLSACADDLGALAVRVTGQAAAGCLLASAPLSPATAARAVGALLAAADGPRGLAVLALRVEGLSVVLVTRARLLELADRGGELAVAAGRDLAAQAAGHVARTLLLPVAVGAVALGGTLLVAEVGRQVLALRGTAPADLPDALLHTPGRAVGAVRDDLVAAATDPELVAAAERLLVEHPEVTDAVTGGLPDLLQGAGGPLAPLLPRDLPETVAALLALGRTQGLFADGDVRVRTGPPPPDLPFGSLGDLFASQTQLGLQCTQEQAAAGSRPVVQEVSGVRVRRVDGPDGATRWIVQVPGTQAWSPRAGTDPSDLTSNLELMDDGAAALTHAVVDAMAHAGVGRHDEVLLTGHSQGGIAALAVAASPTVRATWTGLHHVVTAGSPVGLVDVPDDVQVLSLEHTRDPVPRLDGVDNPDTPGWTTVRRDVLPEVQREAVRAGGDPWNPVLAHAVGGYAATAGLVDRSDDPALAPVLAGLAPFLTGDGATTDVVLTRGPEQGR